MKLAKEDADTEVVSSACHFGHSDSNAEGKRVAVWHNQQNISIHLLIKLGYCGKGF